METATLGARTAPAPALPRAIAAVPLWVWFLLTAVAARAATFGNPVIQVDESFYLTTARSMLHGAIPFVDVWDRKPVGLFLLYLPAAAFGVPGGVWVYQAMALASVVLTAMLIARMAQRAGWGAGALAAGMLYVLCLDLADGQGGQSPVFYNLPMALAMLLILPRDGEAADVRGRHRRGLGAMALIGIALQIKYSVVFEGMFIGLWLLWRELRLGAPVAATLRHGAALVATALAPTALALAAYVAIGHGDAFIYANFTSIFSRQSDPAGILAVNFLRLSLILAPLLICSGMSRHVDAPEASRAVRKLLFGWLIAAVFAVVIFGDWFNHYSLPVMLPAALCAAGFLGSHRVGRKLAPVLVLLVLAVGQYIVGSMIASRGNGEQVEALADTIGHGPGCLYVYSSNAILYDYTDRCTVTKWIFPSHLSLTREQGAVGIDPLGEIDRIFARKPEYVVMRPWYRFENPAARARTLEYLDRDYVLHARRPLGKEMIDVFRRRPGADAADQATAPSPRFDSIRE